LAALGNCFAIQRGQPRVDVALLLELIKEILLQLHKRSFIFPLWHFWANVPFYILNSTVCKYVNKRFSNMYLMKIYANVQCCYGTAESLLKAFGEYVSA
jgi:hypothetical protein